MEKETARGLRRVGCLVGSAEGVQLQLVEGGHECSPVDRVAAVVAASFAGRVNQQVADVFDRAQAGLCRVAAEACRFHHVADRRFRLRQEEAGAGGLFWFSWQQSQQTAQAPLPAKPVHVPANTPVVGPAGDKPVQTPSGEISTSTMAPSSVLIPALSAYSQIVGENEFVESRYRGFDTLQIPEDPQKTAWYTAGGALTGGDEGTTLLASHVSFNGQWGVFRDLYALRGGELVYTKDANGAVQTWKITTLTALPHTQFPAAYWSATGTRQLVITTCGGTSVDGHYSDNIFAIATPLEPPINN